MIYSDKFPDVFSRPDVRGKCFTGMEVIALAGTALSAGMTVLGAVGQSNAQREAGDIAYRNAQLRNQQMEQQARQLEQQSLQQKAAANREASSGQREAIERIRKGRLMASRAKAVMAASGAGVDDSMVAGLLAEADYAGDVALYEGDERARVQRNAATVSTYNAAASRSGGQAALWQGENVRGASSRAADATLIGGLAKAGIGLAAKYGEDWGWGSDAGDVAAARAVDRYGTVTYDEATGYNSVF